MAEYKGIKGFKVQYLSADPSDPNIGQTWYNDTSKDLKYTDFVATGSWASGGSLSTARKRLGGAGTQTAALAFAGGPPNSASTEAYNGTAWTGGGNLSIAREGVGGCGIQTAALAFGGEAGSTRNETEEYDGTSWSPGGTLPVGKNMQQRLVHKQQL